MPLFEDKPFVGHARKELSFKIECDALTDEDLSTLAALVGRTYTFSKVHGVPRGGLRFAKALEKHRSPIGPELIVDDVLTTGTSMEEMKHEVGGDPLGIVIFARGACPEWVRPLFSLSLWASS